MKKSMNSIPAVLPTMMLSTEMSVSKPPCGRVLPPEENRATSRIGRLLEGNPRRDPTMIMAVALLSTAEKTTVMTP